MILTEHPLFEHLFSETERKPQTVSELNADICSALEKRFASVWVEGEIVNFASVASGHWYFSLNDGQSQIKAACFRGSNYRIRFRPRNGISVRVRGRVSIFEPKGELQLIVDSLEPSGEGALLAAFEQIKAKLEAEGLFSDALKRPVPSLPRRIAVVTSPSGAAYHDIHNVLTRRARSVSILLIPVQVQGEGAADSIRRAVIGVNRYNAGLDECDRVDVMIVGRGGGSAEDLWAFNDEALARAIRSSAIPVISAVGHEIDWTICDWVCDLRAATPSAAAELVAQREADIIQTFLARESQMRSIVEYKLLDASTRTAQACESLRVRSLDRVDLARERFASVTSRLSPANLAARTAQAAARLGLADERRSNAMTRRLKALSEKLNLRMAKLDALSPLAVLTRGYSITQTADGEVLRDASSVSPGDRLKIRLEHGKLDAEVLAS